MPTTTVYTGTVVELRAVLGTYPTTLMFGVGVGATTLVLADATGYSAADTLILAPGEPNEERLEIASISRHTLTLAATTEFVHAVGETAYRGATSGTVTMTVRLPDLTTSTPAVTAAAPIYTATYTTTMAGRHTWQAATSGASATVEERSFEVLTP